MQALRLSEILRGHEGEWVALNKKRTQVLASGSSLDKVMSLLKEEGREKPIITFVPRFDADYVG